MTLNFNESELHIGNAGTPPLQFFKRGFNLNGSGGSTPSWKDIILSGNTALTLVNAKANSLSSLKLFGGTEQRNLPKGYTQYEYLRSTGTQYIDLGYKGNGNTKVKVKFRYHTATSATGSGRVFGSRTTSSSNAFGVGTSAGIVSEATNTIFWCYDNQPYFTYDENFGLDVWKTVVLSATEHSIDGVSVGNDYNIVEFETPQTLKLFGFDNNGTMGIGYVDIAFCQLWDNGVLVRDVVPAGDGTTNSMYDRVSGTMLPNAGTGDFVAGDAVVPTPDAPIDIVCNNGAIKYSLNMANVNAQTALVGYYISNSGVVMESPQNWIYQDYIPVEPSTTYTLTMSTPVYYVTISEYKTADDGGFSRRNAGSTGGNTTLTITTRSTTKYLRFGANIDSSDVTLDKVFSINWMLNKGNSMPYAPYIEGGIYTDGTVETVNVHGKNLLDLASCIDGYYYTPTGVYAPAPDARLSDYIPVKAGVTYTVGLNGLQGGANVRLNLLDTEKNWLSQTVFVANAGIEYAQTITPTQDGFFAFSANFTSSSYIDWNTAQVVQGSYTVETMPEYEPYFNGGSATAEMLLKVGDYQDVQSVLDGKVDRNVGIKVLDGAEDWSRTDVRTKLVLTDSATGSADWEPYCTHYQGFLGSASIGNMPDNSCKINVNTNELLIKDTTHNTDLATWKQFLADQYANGTPVIVLYPISSPTTETVTGQPLTIQAGTNVVEITQASIDNLELEVSYKGTV